MAGDMCGRGGHAWQGGMHGRETCVAGGHAWQGGMRARGCAWDACPPADTTRYGQ